MDGVRVYITGSNRTYIDTVEAFMGGLDLICDNQNAISSFEYRTCIQYKDCVDEPYHKKDLHWLKAADVVVNLWPDGADPNLQEEIELAEKLGKEIVTYGRKKLDFDPILTLYKDTIAAMNRVLETKRRLRILLTGTDEALSDIKRYDDWIQKLSERYDCEVRKTEPRLGNKDLVCKNMDLANTADLVVDMTIYEGASGPDIQGEESVVWYELEHAKRQGSIVATGLTGAYQEADVYNIIDHMIQMYDEDWKNEVE